MHKKGFRWSLWCIANVYEVLTIIITKITEEIRKAFIDDKYLICTLKFNC